MKHGINQPASWLMVVLLVFLLSGCGFRPVYRHHDRDVIKADSHDVSASYDLISSVEVMPINHLRRSDETMVAASLQRALTDRFAMGVTKPLAKRYRLEIRMELTRDASIVSSTGYPTRYRMHVTTYYRLYHQGPIGNTTHANVSRVCDEGTIALNDQYDVMQSPFASYSAQETMTDHIVKEIAEQYRMRLIALLLRDHASSESRSGQAEPLP